MGSADRDVPRAGALMNLGLDLGRSAIQRILRAHGIEPALLRGETLPWKTFLKAHWGAIAAADFFNVEVLTHWGIVPAQAFVAGTLHSRGTHLIAKERTNATVG